MGVVMVAGTVAIGVLLAQGVIMIVLMVMIVSVRVVVAGTFVGSALRVERRLHRLARAAQAFDHVFDHVVRPNEQRLSGKLRGQVAIAQVPGDAHQRRDVGGTDGDQVLRRRLDGHESAVFQLQPVTVAQVHDVGLIQQDRAAVARTVNDASASAMVVVETDHVTSTRSAVRDDRCDTLHGCGSVQ
jgi:hypothetical protein